MAKPLNNPIATKTVNGARIQNLSCIFGADLFCTQDETYKNTPSVFGTYSIIKSNTADKSYYLVSMTTHVNYNQFGKADCFPSFFFFLPSVTFILFFKKQMSR